MTEAQCVGILDLREDEKGSPIGELDYFTARRDQELWLRWSVDSQPKGFVSIAGGALFVRADGKDDLPQKIPPSKDARPTKIGISRYKWEDHLSYRHIVFVIILPSGYTVKNPYPKPTDVRNFNGRMELFWVIDRPPSDREMIIAWDMEKAETNINVATDEVARTYIYGPNEPEIFIDRKSSKEDIVPSMYPVGDGQQMGTPTPRPSRNTQKLAIPIIVALIGFVGAIGAAVIVALATFLAPIVEELVHNRQMRNIGTPTLIANEDSLLSPKSTTQPLTKLPFTTTPTPTYTLTPTKVDTYTPTPTPTSTTTPTSTPTIFVLTTPIFDNFDAGLSDVWDKRGNYSITEGWLFGKGDPFKGETIDLKINEPLSDYTVSFDCRSCGQSFHEDVVIIIAETLQFSIGRVQYLKDLSTGIKIHETGYTDSEGHFEFRITENTYVCFVDGVPTFPKTTYGESLTGPFLIKIQSHGVSIDNLEIKPSN